MENMEIYRKAAAVPVEAQKPIAAGRLKGMTDINPMWRIAKLTEIFGVCGFGWKYEIVSQRLEAGDNDSVCAFVDINLYVKVDGEWSDAIPGIGGASYISNERNGKYTSDECFKMALTDALSVACKALGFGADIYWAAGRSKYTAQESAGEAVSGFGAPVQANTATKVETAPVAPRDLLVSVLKQRGMDVNQFALARGLNKSTSDETYLAILAELGVEHYA